MAAKPRPAFLTEPARRVPVTERRDVIVAGGGPSGVMAAVAAARRGADVLLTEARGCLGGVAMMGLPIQGYCDRDGARIVAGLAEEFRARLAAIGGAMPDFMPCAMHNPYLVVDPESVKQVCQQMLEDANVSLLLHAPVVDVVKNDGAIEAALIEGKSGREALMADVFIDATGDADLAARAGASFHEVAVDQLQASSLNCLMTGVDTDAIRRAVKQQPERYRVFPLLDADQLQRNERYIFVGLDDIVQSAQRGLSGDQGWNSACYITLVAPGMVCLNTIHVGHLTPHDTRDLTTIERRTRAQVRETVSFYQKHVPGFENAVLASTAPWSGIRESRAVVGLDTMDIARIKVGAHPADTVAMGGYPVDIHDPNAGELVFYSVPPYGIPYGCMVPRGLTNLLVTGRAISATHEAMATTRLMAQCMALGQAAGTAAALCAAGGIAPAGLDVAALRAQLAQDGAIL